MTNGRIGRAGLTAVALAAALLLSSCARDNSGGEATPEPTLAIGTATLDAPADDMEVKQCERFSGRAALPADRTLILGVRNLDNGDPKRYFQAVDGWEYPEELDRWDGSQWFGSGDSSVDQEFRVELLTIDLDAAEKATQLSKTKGWSSPENPPGTQVQAHITLKRVAGPGPAECS